MNADFRISPTLLVVLAAAALAGCDGEEAEAPLRPVRYERVYATGGSRVRTFSGTARAGVESRLSFKVPGTIRRLGVQVGDSVRAGELIAELDPEDYRLELQRAQAALAQARAQARNAEVSYERTRLLYENNTAAKGDLDAARAAYESAQATVSAQQQSLELARLQLSYTRLTAPVAGAVATVNVEVNENVSSGQAIVLLTSGSRLEVDVVVPEVLIARVRGGDTVSVTFDALPNRDFAAVITEVGVAATGAGSTFPVVVLLQESDPNIRSGMAAEVGFRFGVEGEREVYLVPSVAVGEDRQGRFVFVVEPSDEGRGIVHRRPVEVGELTPEGFEILSGLNDGDRVVTAGVSKIEDGMTVLLLGA